MEKVDRNKSNNIVGRFDPNFYKTVVNGYGGVVMTDGKQEMVERIKTCIARDCFPYNEAAEYISNFVLQAQCEAVEDVIKPLKIFDKQKNSGYGLTTHSSIAVIDKVLSNASKYMESK